MPKRKQSATSFGQGVTTREKTYGGGGSSDGMFAIGHVPLNKSGGVGAEAFFSMIKRDIREKGKEHESNANRPKGELGSSTDGSSAVGREKGRLDGRSAT